jgi:hypothetical protein
MMEAAEKWGAGNYEAQDALSGNDAPVTSTLSCIVLRCMRCKDEQLDLTFSEKLKGRKWRVEMSQRAVTCES